MKEVSISAGKRNEFRNRKLFFSGRVNKCSVGAGKWRSSCTV